MLVDELNGTRGGNNMKTILPSTTNYGGKRSSTKYLVIHYTGSPDGSAEANAKYFVTANRGASAHYFVGLNGEIVASVPEDMTAWHCGASKYRHKEARNSNSIGIELCCKKINHATKNATDQDWYFTMETVDSAIHFVANLMKHYGIDRNHVIRHYDVTGKICPAPWVHNELQWELFLDSLDKFIINANEVPPAPVPVPQITPAITDDGSFKVRLKSDMNIRKGASTLYGTNGVAKIGVYTIIETKGNWGKLKSGAGWINISDKYAERV